MKRDNIEVNDRQLACARIDSLEGQNYLAAMAAAANYAWVNRSSMTFLSRQVVEKRTSTCIDNSSNLGFHSFYLLNPLGFCKDIQLNSRRLGYACDL